MFRLTTGAPLGTFRVSIGNESIAIQACLLQLVPHSAEQRRRRKSNGMRFFRTLLQTTGAFESNPHFGIATGFLTRLCYSSIRAVHASAPLPLQVKVTLPAPVMATLCPTSTTPAVPGPSMTHAGGVGFPLSSVALTQVISTGPWTAELAGCLPLESELADIVFESAWAL